MMPRILSCLVALAGMLLVSCYPYPENQARQTHPTPKPRPAHPTQPPQANTQTAQGKPVPAFPPPRIPAEAARPGTARSGTQQPTAAPPAKPVVLAPTGANTPVPAKAPAPARRDYPTAKMAPGRDGFVLSPYNNKLILVRGIPSGTILPDATYPASENKFFRVP